MGQALKRRELLFSAAAAVGAGAVSGCRTFCESPDRFKTRGVVVFAKDLQGSFDWVALARDAGLTTIATHVGLKDVVPFMRSSEGRRFLSRCKDYGIKVEHELHAMSDLLPRSLFKTHPEYFRLDENKKRNPDGNLCPSCREAIDIVVKNAIETAKVCVSTSGRYYFWRDDGEAMVCNCPKCKGLTATDQALVVENAILSGLRREVNPQATLAHLAYGPTYAPPSAVRPDEGLFLEYAPYDTRLARQALGDRDWTRLDMLLRHFPSDTAQALEYWLDESLFCQYKADSPVKIPWDSAKVAQDLEDYSSRGIRHVTTFAAWIGDGYVSKFGKPDCVCEYGRLTGDRY